MSDQPGSSYLLCPGCGSILELDSVFCKFCGASTRARTPDSAAPRTSQTPPETSPAPLVAPVPPTAPVAAVPATANVAAAPPSGRGGLLSPAVLLTGAALLFCALFLAGVVYFVERSTPSATVEEGKKEDLRSPLAGGAGESNNNAASKSSRPPEVLSGPKTKTAPLPVLPSGPGGASGSGGSGGLSPAGLTNANVSAAVGELLKAWRLGGSVSVIGVQEQGTSAVADLRFQGFEYAVTHLGQLLRASEYRPPARRTRNPGDPLPSPDEMFPPRKRSFTGEGKARLTRYNDGRWVLKEVRWGSPFDGLGVNGTVEIR